MKELAPIVLFVYNRPWHTRRTLEALSRNQLADQSKLFIYADGPKESASEEQLQNIYEVRKLISGKKWCREVEVIEREKNVGLASSVISGVTEIVNKFGKVIVLEDDLVTSVGFLKYMNDALEMYEGEESVAAVSGYCYPINTSGLPPTFFLRLGECWGWGTWKQSWKFFEADASTIFNQIIEKKLIRLFDFNETYPFTATLGCQVKKDVDSWAIRWYAAIFIRNMLTLYPSQSFVKNIGNDSTGSHMPDVNYFDVDTSNSFLMLQKEEAKENELARRRMEQFFKKNFIRNTFRIKDFFYEL